ncbi:hypothetical protein ANANG_G00296480 [Anguilla anguilla]|uniref:FH2 domain-containing protein n=1 Tax=Anguilla anguilla TaxID=7936 RepID=A0A9D3RK14_ANGAN|nr:hypothetical protein ANANG_G00296480 [Anguilla anguilla]
MSGRATGYRLVPREHNISSSVLVLTVSISSSVLSHTQVKPSKGLIQLHSFLLRIQIQTHPRSVHRLLLRLLLLFQEQDHPHPLPHRYLEQDHLHPAPTPTWSRTTPAPTPTWSRTAPPPPPPGAGPPPPGGGPPPPGGPTVGSSGPGVKGKKPIQTKYRMPLLNWQALKPTQVTGTVFSELDDENVLGELNMMAFEEQFKTKAQGAPPGLDKLKVKTAKKEPSKVALIESNRAKNLAITLRKAGIGAAQICTAIENYDQEALSLDFLELLERFIPSDYELKLIQNYEREGRPLEDLSDEDRFMVRFGKIPRLAQRINTLTFMGNFPTAPRRCSRN